MLVKLEDQPPFLRNLARYGVPFVILIFYATASLYFDYSPDELFKTVVSVRDSLPGSLWEVFLSLGRFLGLDLLLTAKIFSMLFSCFAILLAYLIAQEILHDYLLSFCVTLTLSMQPWLLQLAPSGSGFGFGLFLMLGAIFFLLRNEYIIAAVFGSLAALVVWQAAGVVIFVMVDVYLNSVEKRRATKLMVSVGLIFFAIALPWILLSTRTGNVLPRLYGMTEIVGQQGLLGIYILSGLAIAGFSYVVIREREEVRIHAAGVLWIVSALMLHVWLLAAPLIVVYGFFGLQKISSNISDGVRRYVVALALTTALLLHQQFLAFPEMRLALRESAEETDELKSIAMWLHTNVKDDERIQMPDRHEGVLRYYSERLSGNGNYVVAAAANISNAELAFDPTKNYAGVRSASIRYSVWRKK